MLGRYALGQGLWRVLGRYALGLGLVAVSCLFRLEMLLFEACCLGWCGYQLFRLGRWGRLAVAGTALSGGVVAALVALTTGYAKTLGPGERDVEQRALAYLLDPAVRAHLPADVWQRLFQVFYNVPDAGAVALRPMGYLTLAALALAIAALLVPTQRPLLLALAAAAVAAAAVAAPAAVNIFYPSVVWSVHGLVLSCPLILAAIAYLRIGRQGRGIIAASFVVFALAELVSSTGGRPADGMGRARCAGDLSAGGDGGRGELGGAGAGEARNSRFKIHWLERAALGVLAALSVGTQARGLVQLRSDLPVSASWAEALQALPLSIVATDIWWLTATVTPVYYRHRFVLLPEGADQIADAQYLASQRWHARRRWCSPRCAWRTASYRRLWWGPSRKLRRAKCGGYGWRRSGRDKRLSPAANALRGRFRLGGAGRRRRPVRVRRR